MSEVNDFMSAIRDLAKEKNIPIENIFSAIKESLKVAVKSTYGKNDNCVVSIDENTGAYKVFLNKTVVETVEDSIEEITLEDAHKIDGSYKYGDVVLVEIKDMNFGRIATMTAKNTIVQKLHDEEKRVLLDEYSALEKKVVTGVITRFSGRNIHVNLGKAEGFLAENEQVKGERYKVQDRIKVYIVEVKAGGKGPRILLSRTHPELVRKLFEEEVSEMGEGIVEIKSIAREAGSRTKIAVYSNDSDVDPVGACVGQNGSRVNAVVDELRGEKIDIIEWSDVSANYIEHALSPAKVIAVGADDDEKEASVIVPDYQLSLAIGKEGQNARLAARLTGYKIDIKSETQAREAGLMGDMEDEYYGDGEYDEDADTEETSEE